MSFSEFLNKERRFGDRSSRALSVKNRAVKTGGGIVRTVILAGLAFVVLYPILYMMTMAFRPSGEILDPTVIWIPKSLTLENVRQVAGVMELSKSLGSTVQIGVISSLLQILSCSVVGYGFARFNFKLKKPLFILVLLQIIIPPQTLIIPQYIDYMYFDVFFLGRIAGLFTGKAFLVNLLDTPWAFYLSAVFGHGIRAGLLIYIFRQFFAGLPRELEDAAYIDGCGPLKTYVKVMMPNAAPAFVTVFLFSTVWYWNDYYFAGMLLTTIQTLSVRLSTLNIDMAGIVGAQYDPYKMICQMQAGSLIVILPPLLLYIIFQRFFTQSIERTGIVG